MKPHIPMLKTCFRVGLLCLKKRWELTSVIFILSPNIISSALGCPSSHDLWMVLNATETYQKWEGELKMFFSLHFVSCNLPNLGLKSLPAPAPDWGVLFLWRGGVWSEGIWGVFWEPGASAPHGSCGCVGASSTSRSWTHPPSMWAIPDCTDQAEMGWVSLMGKMQGMLFAKPWTPQNVPGAPLLFCSYRNKHYKIQRGFFGPGFVIPYHFTWAEILFASLSPPDPGANPAKRPPGEMGRLRLVPYYLGTAISEIEKVLSAGVSLWTYCKDVFLMIPALVLCLRMSSPVLRSLPQP